MNLEVLADIPLHRSICATSDAGTPIAIADPSSKAAMSYHQLATRVWDILQNSQTNPQLGSAQVKVVEE